MVLAVESESDQSVPNHCQNEGNAAQVKSGLCQNRFASQERFGNAACEVQRPRVMSIVPIGEGDEEAGVGDTFHERENPLRLERFLGPRTVPARRMKV